MDNARREEEYARQRRTEERERCEEQAAVDQIRAEMQREIGNLRAEMLREREFVLEVVGTAIGEFSNKRAFAIALALGGVPGSGNSGGSLLNCGSAVHLAGVTKLTREDCVSRLSRQVVRDRHIHKRPVIGGWASVIWTPAGLGPISRFLRRSACRTGPVIPAAACRRGQRDGPSS